MLKKIKLNFGMGTLIIFNKPAPAPVTIATRPSKRNWSMLCLDTTKIKKITFTIYTRYYIINGLLYRYV